MKLKKQDWSNSMHFIKEYARNSGIVIAAKRNRMELFPVKLKGKDQFCFQ